MIAPGQSINPLQFTKLHNKTISKHFYESPTFASLCPAEKGCWSKNSLAAGWSQSRQQYRIHTTSHSLITEWNIKHSHLKESPKENEEQEFESGQEIMRKII